ncbi:S8 family serine peptidase [Micromonospora sp. WMMA1923]|uniref:S8 family serine peptidase n=1 Tax=Micromonospora sp. WMMA1923 TaxID=3404125 RepID=UPI003B95DA7A
MIPILAISLLTTAGHASSASDGSERVRSDQWHLNYLKATEAHRITQGEGVTVAIPDTGVDPHPDLRENLLRGTDIISGIDDGRADKSGHGTSMAGLVAAHGRGANLGALGIAPKASILPIRAKMDNKGGDIEYLADSIEWAIANGADVISVSAVSGTNTRLETSLRTAQQSNIIVVAAAGNRPDDSFVGYPASEPGVVAVGGIDREGNHATVSVTGPEIDVVAPAVDLYSTSYQGKYSKGTGTSGATAIVAGAVALIRAKYPSLPAREVVHRLTYTAVDKGPPGRDDQYGYGVIDLVAALTADVPPSWSALPTADASAGRGPTSTAAGPVADGRGAGSDGSTVRGLVTLGVLVVGGGAWAYVVRRRRRGDDPPPRISR